MSGGYPKNTQNNIKKFNQKLNITGDYSSLFELKKLSKKK